MNVSINNKPRIKKRKTKKCRNKLMTKKRLSITINNEKSTTKIVKSKKGSKKTISNLNCKNITNDRITIKHGLFAKGTRSETIKRSELTEEYKARSKENLNQIIDLANGKPICGIFTENMETLDKFKVSKNTSTKPKINDPIINSSPEEPPMEIKITQNDKVSNSTPEVSQFNPINFPPARRSTAEVIPTPVELLPSKNKNLKILPDKCFADYRDIFTKITDNIPNIAKKFLPKDEDATETIKNCLMQVFKTKRQKQMMENSSMQRQSISCNTPQSPIYNKEPVDDLVLLNPLLYLKKFHKTEKSKDISDFKHEIQTRSCSQNTLERCAAQNIGTRSSVPNKYIESLNNFTAVGEDGKDFEIEENTRRKRISNLTNCDSDNSEGYRSDVISMYITDATPEQVYYPRRMNFNKQ